MKLFLSPQSVKLSIFLTNDQSPLLPQRRSSLGSVSLQLSFQFTPRSCVNLLTHSQALTHSLGSTCLMTNPVHKADSKCPPRNHGCWLLQPSSHSAVYRFMLRAIILIIGRGVADKGLLSLLRSFLNIITRHRQQRKNSEYLPYRGARRNNEFFKKHTKIITLQYWKAQRAYTQAIHGIQVSLPNA